MARSKEKSQAFKLPMMPVRDVVIFPYMTTPFVVGRDSSIRALKAALASDQMIFLATQHDAKVEEPKADEIYEVGTIATIIQNLELPFDNVKILVQGLERAVILKLDRTKGYFEATVSTMTQPAKMSPALQATIQRVERLLEKYAKLKSLDRHHALIAERITDPSKLSDLIAQELPLELEDKQNLLEIFDPVKRLDLTAELLADEIATLQKDGEH